MPKARFVGADGAESILEVPVGENLMQAAVDNLVPGVIGDCGGFAECGTCHVFVDQRFSGLLAARSEDEEIMLEGLLNPVTEASRLSCQIVMTGELDGITVHIPEEQG